MSCKVAYNNNSMNRKGDIFIDDSNMLQNNGYWKFRDLIRDGNKKSYLKIFIFVAINIIAFLLGYFTFCLTSPASKNHEILFGGKAALNYSKVIICNNQTFIVTPKLENVTKFTSSTTESSIHSNPTTENIHNIITEEYSKKMISTMTTLPRIFTTIPSITENSTEIAAIELQEDMISCLKNVTNRFEETHSTVPDKCFNDPIAKKSMIIFDQIKNSTFDCLITNDEKCDGDFYAYKEVDIKIFHLKHIRYNFLMRGNGDLYEGRPLSCSFDDTKDRELRYNNSQIIIGMPSCHILDSQTGRNRIKLVFFVRQLIDCLDKQGILSDTYTMRFHKDCKNYADPPFTHFFKNRVKFINDNEEYED